MPAETNEGHTPEQGDTPTALSERVRVINTATGGIYNAFVSLSEMSEGKPMPAEGMEALSSALTLINCGVIALTEIADAQQRMVALAELDVAAEIRMAVDDEAEAKADVKFKETTKRTFMGQHRKAP